MKRSKSVSLGFVSFASLALLAGCSSPDRYTRQCVDKDDRQINDASCNNGTGRWIYMGNGSSFRGGRAYGYQSVMPATGEILGSNGGTVRAAPSSRGGFGSSGSGFFGG